MRNTQTRASWNRREATKKKKRTWLCRQDDRGRDFPPFAAIRQKRKEIPPTEKIGKRTRFFRNEEGIPREGMRNRVGEMGTLGPEREMEEKEQGWVEVTSRRMKAALENERRGVETDRRIQDKTRDDRAKVRNTPRRGNKPQAIAVRFGKEMSFADILKKVKGVSGTTPEGVKSVKQTRAGNLLIEFTPGADLERFKRNIDGKQGEEVEVAKLQEKMDVEIRGSDPSVDKEEVWDAIRRELEHEAKEVRIKVLRTDPRQNKVAVVEGPAIDMNKIIDNR